MTTTKVNLFGKDEAVDCLENGYFRFKDGTELNFYEIDALGGYMRTDHIFINILREAFREVEKTGFTQDIQRILEKYRMYLVPAEFKRVLGLLTESEQGRVRLFNTALRSESSVKVVRRWDNYLSQYTWAIRTCGASVSRVYVRGI